MKEPKIIEIAVLLLAVLYATLSWNIHHILDYIITNFTSYYIYIYIFIWFIYPSNWIHGSKNISAVGRRSLLEELHLHSRDADAHSTRPHENVGAFRKSFVELQIQMIPNGPNLHKASKNLRQCSGPCLLSARPSRMPILETSMAIIHSVAMDRYPCPKAMLLASSFRKTKDACLVIGYLREGMRYLLPRSKHARSSL